MPIQLTDEQKNVAEKITDDVKKGDLQYRVLAGCAGAGKSTLLSFISKKFPTFAPCAFSGKATSVLRRKGIQNANTIHSTIYRAEKDSNGNVEWYLAPSVDCDGFLIDEASTVSKEIHDDLLSFGLPIIYVGDHYQLEPIGTKFNLMLEPDYKLEQIHRNAGEIAHLGFHLRSGNPARTFKAEKQVQLVNYKAIKPRHLAKADQVICAFNKTRIKLNEEVRKELHLEYTYIAPGERVICLRNCRHQGLYNGLQGVVQKIKNKGDRFDFVADGQFYYDILYDPEQFGKETNDFEYSQKPHPFDYAYVLTAHKCVSEDTLIPTENGLLKIKNIWDDETKGRLQDISLKVATIDGSQEAIQLFKGDKERAIKIKTNIGLQLTGSFRHPVLKWNADTCEVEWVLLPNVKVGDYVAISRESNMFPTKHLPTNFYFKKNWRHKPVLIPSILNESIGLLLGWLVGDGHYAKNKNDSLSIANMDIEILDGFTNITKKEFGVDVREHHKKSPNKAKVLYFCSSEVRQYMKSIGLDFVVKDAKEVPFGVLQSPKSVQKMFLRGLFDTDGSCKRSIRLVNVSKRLLEQTQLLLLNFGIVSNITKQFNKKYKKYYYTLSIYSSNMQKYHDLIGFTIKYKQDNLIAIIKSIKKTNLDILPGMWQLLRELKREINESGQKISKVLSKQQELLLYKLIRKESNVSYKHLRDMITSLDKTLHNNKLPSFVKIKTLLKQNFYFDKIESVEETSAQMYDFSVPSNESFVGNGLISHNSQGDEFDNVIVYEQRCANWDHNKWAYTAATRAKRGLIWILDNSR